MGSQWPGLSSTMIPTKTVAVGVGFVVVVVVVVAAVLWSPGHKPSFFIKREERDCERPMCVTNVADLFPLQQYTTIYYQMKKIE